MADRGRKPGFRMTEEHRLKIKNSNILSKLIKCAEGEEEMSSTQATVGLGLMKKVMPDLSSHALTDPDGEALPITMIELVAPDDERKG